MPIFKVDHEKFPFIQADFFSTRNVNPMSKSPYFVELGHDDLLKAQWLGQAHGDVFNWSERVREECTLTDFITKIANHLQECWQEPAMTIGIYTGLYVIQGKSFFAKVEIDVAVS